MYQAELKYRWGLLSDKERKGYETRAVELNKEAKDGNKIYRFVALVLCAHQLMPCCIETRKYLSAISPTCSVISSVMRTTRLVMPLCTCYMDIEMLLEP